MLRSFQFKKAVHVQVSAGSPLGSGDVPQPGRNPHQRGLSVREAADHAGVTTDLAHDSLQRIIGADAPPVFLWTAHIAQCLFNALINVIGRLAELHPFELLDPPVQGWLEHGRHSLLLPSVSVHV